MSVETNISKYKFSVEPFQEDFTGKLSWRNIGIRILQVSSQHATEHNFCSLVVGGEKCGWVLSRLSIEMVRRPKSGEIFYIDTWVNKVYRHFTNRNYYIYDEHGNVIGKVMSVWALIGMDSRNSVNLECLESCNTTISKILVDRPMSFDAAERFKFTNVTDEHEITAHYSDLDINGHVNSIRYIEFFLDIFKIDTFKNTDVCRVDMIYCKESYSNDKLTIQAQKISDKKSIFVAKNEHGDIICKSQVVLREK